MQEVIVKFICRLQSERGQTLAEYALILAFIAMAAVAALTIIGTSLDSKLTSFTDVLT